MSSPAVLGSAAATSPAGSGAGTPAGGTPVRAAPTLSRQSSAGSESSGSQLSAGQLAAKGFGPPPPRPAAAASRRCRCVPPPPPPRPATVWAGLLHLPRAPPDPLASQRELHCNTHRARGLPLPWGRLQWCLNRWPLSRNRGSRVQAAASDPRLAADDRKGSIEPLLALPSTAPPSHFDRYFNKTWVSAC